MGAAAVSGRAQISNRHWSIRNRRNSFALNENSISNRRVKGYSKTQKTNQKRKAQSVAGVSLLLAGAALGRYHVGS